MRRLSRLLLIVLAVLGSIPCELREALPVLAGIAAGCCDEPDGDDGDAPGDCCDSTACAGAVPLIDAPALRALHPAGFLVVATPTRVERPTWNTGPPPTPPPIA